MTRCQICGRRVRLRREGGIAHHHVQSHPCPGIGHPPIEQDDAALISRAAERAEAAERLGRELAALYASRANWIDPALKEAHLIALTEARRLHRRLRLHHGWPERFARQMARQGWGDPPPAYLIERASLPRSH